MRAAFLLSLAAPLALVACGDSPDEELTDEALSEEEGGAAMQDNGTMLSPGEYSTEVELISFEVPSARSIDMDRLQSEFAAGAGQQASFCVSEQMDRESMISALTDNSCDITRITSEGESFDMAMTCEAEDGPQGRIALNGTMAETEADFEMRFAQPLPAIGDANVVMRVQARRTGDCAA